MGVYAQGIAGQTSRPHDVAKIAAALVAERQQRAALGPDGKPALIGAAFDLADRARGKASVATPFTVQ